MNGLTVSEPNKEQLHQTGPYFVFQSENQSDKLICDFGDVAAEHLPAHGHCDLLGFEASLGGRRWIIDSGNGCYDDNEDRFYCRSSVAHNVMTVGSENQCDIWSRFRMGRRGKVLYSKDVEMPGWSCATAAHDGYQRQGVRQMQRMIAFSPEAWICADFAHGMPACSLIGYLHFAPEVQIKKRSASEFVISQSGMSMNLTFLGCNAMKLLESMCYVAFGHPQRHLSLIHI